MNITVITPSFNQLDYLKRCVMSVADQAPGSVKNYDLSSEQERNASDDLKPNHLKHNIHGDRLDEPISVHHHIQDGGSKDGAHDFLAMHEAKSFQQSSKGYSFSYESVSDEGMYEALNRGFGLSFLGQKAAAVPEGLTPRREGVKQNLFLNNQQPIPINSHESVFAWLNCDEQYLPGTLQKAASFFSEHPDVDMLFGGMLMVDENGELLACRKAMPMRKLFLEASYLYNFSCAMFFRKSIWEKMEGFDTSFKNAGDEELIRRALRLGAKTAVMEDYLSIFTYTNENLSSDPSAFEEHERLKQSGAPWARSLKLPINLVRLLEKALRGGYQRPVKLSYEIYVSDAAMRKRFDVMRPVTTWPDSSKPYLTSHRLKRSTDD